MKLFLRSLLAAWRTFVYLLIALLLTALLAKNYTLTFKDCLNVVLFSFGVYVLGVLFALWMLKLGKKV